MDANIEETANDGTEYEEDNRPKVEWDGGPVLGFKNIFKHEVE